MRKIWQKEFGELFERNLSSEELERYQETFTEPETIAEMRTQSDIQLPLFLKAIGCRCLDSMKRFQEASWNIFDEAYGEDMEAYLADKEKREGNPRYSEMLQKLSRSAARRRECHMRLRGFTCYCDEHQHA